MGFENNATEKRPKLNVEIGEQNTIAEKPAQTQKDIPKTRAAIVKGKDIKSEINTVVEYEDDLSKDEVITVSKPKLKKVNQDILMESPMERLTRLENAKPVEAEDFDYDSGELISSLPDYDLPAQRQKTKLEDYAQVEKEFAPKSKKTDEKFDAEWTMLAPHLQEVEKRSSIIF